MPDIRIAGSLAGPMECTWSVVKHTQCCFSHNLFAVQVTVKGNIADFLTPGLKCTASCALPASSPPKVCSLVRDFL